MSKVVNKFLAQAPADTLKGNNTAGTANVTDLTVSQVNTMLGTLIDPMTTTGDIIYENATPAPDRLPVGSNGQVLTVSSGLPSWQTPSAGGFDFQVGPACTTISTGVTSGSFVTADNSPTLTFTPSQTGTYYVTSSAILNIGSVGQSGAIKVANTVGSATIVVEQPAYSTAGSAAQGADITSLYTYGIYTLTASTSYSFDIQLQLNGTGQVYLDARGATVYISAFRIG